MYRWKITYDDTMPKDAPQPSHYYHGQTEFIKAPQASDALTMWDFNHNHRNRQSMFTRIEWISEEQYQEEMRRR